jgi:hypothetical protein
VSSMGPYPKIPKSLERRFYPRGVGSWSIEEYLMAIQSDEFRESVGHPFQGDGTDLDERRKLVESKFYYAGTCPRFMFGHRLIKSKIRFPRILGQSHSARETVLQLNPYCRMFLNILC